MAISRIQNLTATERKTLLSLIETRILALEVGATFRNIELRKHPSQEKAHPELREEVNNTLLEALKLRKIRLRLLEEDSP